MKTNKPYTLFSLFLGIVSVGYTSTSSARFIAHCQTIHQPGLYTLQKNLSPRAPRNDCLIVNADHVTIDLNGYVISGTGIARPLSNTFSPRRLGTGISGSEILGLHVRNGTITRFGIAVLAAIQSI